MASLSKISGVAPDGSITVGFMPEPGTRLLVIGENIKHGVNEKSGQAYISIPLIVDDSDDVCAGASFFENIQFEGEYKATNEKKLARLLTIIGAVEGFEKWFAKVGNPEDVLGDSSLAETISNKLASTIPGKTFKAEITVEKSVSKTDPTKEYTNVRIHKYMPSGKGAKAAGGAPAAARTVAAPVAAGGGDDDWPS